MIYNTIEELQKVTGPEVWRPFVINTGTEYKTHNWYSISNWGRAASHLRRGRKSPGQERVDLNRKTIMTTTDNSCVLGHKRMSFVFPTDFFDYDYAKAGGSYDTVIVKFYLHQLVMWAFNPIEGDPPALLADCWDNIPETAKVFIDSLLVTNHINHNPAHNFLANLERVRQKENTRSAKDYYGGNPANKKQFKTDHGEDLEVVSVIEEERKPSLQLFYA